MKFTCDSHAWPIVASITNITLSGFWKIVKQNEQAVVAKYNWREVKLKTAVGQQLLPA